MRPEEEDRFDLASPTRRRGGHARAEGVAVVRAPSAVMALCRLAAPSDEDENDDDGDEDDDDVDLNEGELEAR